MKVKSVERVENQVRLIDQTKLPHELVYLDIDDTWTLTGKKAQAAIHAVCDSGNTCKINLQLD